jgi:hypothetical protein
MSATAKSPALVLCRSATAKQMSAALMIETDILICPTSQRWPAFTRTGECAEDQCMKTVKSKHAQNGFWLAWIRVELISVKYCWLLNALSVLNPSASTLKTNVLVSYPADSHY